MSGGQIFPTCVAGRCSYGRYWYGLDIVTADIVMADIVMADIRRSDLPKVCRTCTDVRAHMCAGTEKGGCARAPCDPTRTGKRNR